MNNEERQRQIIENYIQAYNAFDVDGMVKNLHPDIVFENITDGITNLKIQGVSAFKLQAEQAMTFFLEREQRIGSIDHKEDMAEVAIEYSGTVAVDLPNGLSAGDKLTLEGKSSFYFEGGKIIRLQDIS
ncbi:nuclear transport factor 2 family protein [Pontibacter korlensis]|uniref:SnoaL-like domain-containing protein n=1 Tax=Pontibacter korlensis TaxID=400092 RepID=A0A0E3UWK9_9BACT|nr:nuclear transport factor 2 family protein [Pontibacter korlensis]AKD03492.1 hypothetical protein PKOR_10595 [Pontibacter korlensis]